MGLAKIILQLLVLTFSFSAIACKYLPDPAYFNPEMAQTIMLVQVENNLKDGSIFFKAKPLWGNQRIQVSSGICVGYSGYESGELLLFYSSLSEKLLKSKIVSASEGTSVSFKDPDAIEERLVWLTKKQEIPTGHPNVFWGHCQKDVECTQAKNSCGEFVGVNKKYQSNYNNYIKNNKFPKTCASKKESLTASRCVENFCS